MVTALDSNVSTKSSAYRHRRANRMEVDQLVSGLLFLVMFFLALALIVNWL